LTELEKASLEYSIDNWNSSTLVDMSIANRTCSATIPGQEAGVTVEYSIFASDVLNNKFSLRGNFTVKQQLSLNITATREKIYLGENTTIVGIVEPENSSLPVKVQFSSGNTTEQIDCLPFENGTISVNYRPKFVGTWEVSARIPESNFTYECSSPYFQLVVAEPPFYVVYSLFIIGGVIGILGASVAVYFLKLRNR
jgi:hypothetical protein